MRHIVGATHVAVGFVVVRFFLRIRTSRQCTVDDFDTVGGVSMSNSIQDSHRFHESGDGHWVGLLQKCAIPFSFPVIVSDEQTVKFCQGDFLRSEGGDQSRIHSKSEGNVLCQILICLFLIAFGSGPSGAHMRAGSASSQF